MKKNIKKFQKPLICLLIILVSIISYTIGKITNAKADEIAYEYQSSNIGYDSTGNSLSATNVKDAIDELYEKVGKCPSGIYCYVKNKSFEKAYTYDESVCITGDETGCVETRCYEDGTCPVGTIIDYAVSSSDVVRFHVLHDDGDTMTMQTQRNTIYNVAWWSGGNDPTKGPQTIMVALKIATDDWTNVNKLMVTSGTKSFIGVSSIDNLCTHDNGVVSCSGNVYDIGLIEGTYKARLITLQEATDSDIGQCKAWVGHGLSNNKSCRMFMNNFLDNSTSGSVCRNTALCVDDNYTEYETNRNYGYWTMNVGYGNVFFVFNNGNVGRVVSDSLNGGARAVVVVNK